MKELTTSMSPDIMMDMSPPKLDVNLNHKVMDSSALSPQSPNPLDNISLKRRSTGLSAFNDYVDLVKRHLMYAVREEVEILKQQIGELMERIGQLEYENTVLRSEALPETLSKLLAASRNQAKSQQQQQQQQQQQIQSQQQQQGKPVGGQNSVGQNQIPSQSQNALPSGQPQGQPPQQQQQQQQSQQPKIVQNMNQQQQQQQQTQQQQQQHQQQQSSQPPQS